jgi:hypothetical protein
MPSFAIASVSDTRAWLTDPTNPTVSPMRFGTQTTSDPNLAQDGDYRQYSNGASQMVRYDTQTSTASYKIMNLTRTQRNQLNNWRTKTLLFRSVDGDRFFVSYLAVQPHRRLRSSDGTPHYDVLVTFNIVSYDESQN